MEESLNKYKIELEDVLETCESLLLQNKKKQEELEEELGQRKKENAELLALCDDLMKKIDGSTMRQL